MHNGHVWSLIKDSRFDRVQVGTVTANERADLNEKVAFGCPLFK